MKDIGMGAVGVGRLGYVHAQNIARPPGAKLIAVCDRQEEMARNTAWADFPDRDKKIGEDLPDQPNQRSIQKRRSGFMDNTQRYCLTVLLMVCLITGVFVIPTAAKDTYKITVVVHGGTNDPFWKMQEKGIRDIQTQIPDIEVSYRGPVHYNLEEFLTILKDAVQEKPDALVCTMSYPPLMDDILRPAIAEGLPVIAINAADMRPQEERIPVLTYIGEDSYRIGVTAAEETLKRFTPKRALFANHHVGAENLEARGRGWIDTMEKHGIPAEQIDTTAEDLGKSSDMVVAYLSRHSDTDVIFSSNIPRARSLIARLELDGYTVGDDIKFVQMDVDPVLLDSIQQDKIMFTIDQQPYLQSYLGVMFAYLYAKYDISPPPAPMSTGPGIVTKENVGEFLEVSEQGIKGKTYRIAVVVHGSQDDPFWKPVKRGVKDAAALYPDVEVTYIGTKVFSVEEFLENLSSAITSRPDALVCTLTDPVGMDDMLRKVIEAGLPVVAMNAPDLRKPEDTRIPVLTYIGEDSYYVGVLAAEETLKRLKPRHAVFFNHQPGAANIDARGRGWVDAMKEKQIRAESVEVSSNTGEAANDVAAFLKSHPDTDVMFISNAGVTEAVIGQLTAEGIEVGNGIKIAQMDISSAVLDYIQDDMIMFTLDQQPYMQGYMGVVFAYMKAKYGFTPPPAPVSTGPAIVTANDINPAKSY